MRPLITLWESVKSKITTSVGVKIWEDVRLALEEKKLGFELNAIFQDAVDLGYAPELSTKVEAVYHQAEKLFDALSQEWQTNRPGIQPNIFDKRRDEKLSALKKRIDLLPVRSMVKTRFCLPDQYGIPYLKISVHTEKGWQELIKRGCFKAASTEDALYEYTNFVEIAGTPDQVKYEYHGMGGVGICFAEVRDSAGKRYFPCAISESSGTVEHPEYLLENDVNFAWLGSQSTRTAYNSRELFQTVHSVTLQLKAN